MSNYVLFPPYDRGRDSRAIDRAVLNDLKAVLGEEGSNTLADLIDLFLADVPSRMQDIRRMTDESLCDGLRSNVEALIGWCETLGAREMGRVCKKMDLFLENYELDREGGFNRAEFSTLVNEVTEAFSRAYSELLVNSAEY